MDGHREAAELEPLLRELLGAVLRAERRRQARTLSQVAGAAGISMQHLSDVERGRKDPSSELLAAIAGALGLRVPDLLLRIADGAAEDRAASARPAVVGRPAVLELHGAAGPGAHRGRRAPSGAGGTAGVTLLRAA
ncbi:helix-turn-helix domain-containing protein [Brachybacterium sp. YJGR34]|uniref:helix-turn-helix domain-containing protein n=1 Tax=Brachybacterium sp. YJGR34 TaxID=2059911 RepID=UPI000E0C4ACA|nr:helix-turn-helix transcriptional regulator [Brachybacterium sp. YJGR34]